MPPAFDQEGTDSFDQEKFQPLMMRKDIQRPEKVMWSDGVMRTKKSSEPRTWMRTAADIYDVGWKLARGAAFPLILFYGLYLLSRAIHEHPQN
jgi:hypothetical protein